jgi:hypothetical protein
LSIFPSTPEVNDTFTSNGTTWKWDGSSWNFFSSPAFIGVGGDATVAFQIDQPDVSELEAGALWIDSDEDISNGLLTATFTRWVSLLSASTLVLEGLDEKDLSLLYTPGFEKVYINGILLVRDEDYTAEDGTTIELNVAAEEGDVAEVDVFESFAIANTYTKTQADNKFLTQNSASAEYLSQDSASAEYLTQTSANETYLEKVNSQASFRNLIINGAMQVAQRGTSVTGNTAGGYLTADRWELGLSSLGTWTQSVDALSGADIPSGTGFRKAYTLLCTTADAAPAAADLMFLVQRIEGQNLQAIRKGTASAQQLTLSFWVRSNVTGTYSVRLGDNDNSRNVAALYSVSSSGTWEKKTIVFPADTTGVLDNDNNNSLFVQFWLAAGSDYKSGTTPTTWKAAATGDIAAGHTANLAAATNNYWQVTGVQLEVGAVATPFEFKPFDQDLRECQRYYMRWNATVVTGSVVPGTGAAIGTSTCDFNISMPVPLRANATALETSNLGVYDMTDAVVRSGGTFAIAYSVNNVTTVVRYSTTALFVTGENTSVVLASGTGFLAISAEL